MKQEPFSNEEVREMSRARLAQARAAGVKFISVLGCNYPPEECDAYRAVKDVIFEIDFAPELPLPGCDQKHCKCIILAEKYARRADSH